jgi:plastocyanin
MVVWSPTAGLKRRKIQVFQLNVFLVCWASLIPWLPLLMGCAKTSTTSSAPPSSSSATGPPTSVVDPVTAGSISGTVYLDGPPPILPAIDMQSEPACSKANPSVVPSQAVLVGKDGVLANVVVYVKDSMSHYRFEAPSTPVALDQKGCVYQPRVVALMTNQPLEIRNSDATIHNVHAMPKTNSEWNKAQRAGSAALTTSFSRPELAIPFMCNVHPWMRAFVFVFDHPYFAVTAGDGKFELRDLPPGTYNVESWHEKLGTHTQIVTIGPKESKNVSLRFGSDVPRND